MLIEDNLPAHRLSVLYDYLPPEKAREIIKKIEIIRTPVHASWLNIAEIELNVLNNQSLKKRFDSKEKIKIQVDEWQKQRNSKLVKVDWLFTTKDARVKLKRLYPVIKELNSIEPKPEN